VKSGAFQSFVADMVSGQHSRREIFRKAAAIGIGASAVGGFLTSIESARAAGSLEVFSWWTSEGEHPALVALFDAFTAANPDVEIIDAGVAGGGGGPAQAVL
jgi:hypothetical protein